MLLNVCSQQKTHTLFLVICHQEWITLEYCSDRLSCKSVLETFNAQHCQYHKTATTNSQNSADICQMSLGQVVEEQGVRDNMSVQDVCMRVVG